MRRLGLAVSDPRHGTTNGYGNLYCRCAACCQANTVQMREYRAKHRDKVNAARRTRSAARRRERDTHRLISIVTGLLDMDHVPPYRRAIYEDFLSDLRREHRCVMCQEDVSG